MGYRGPCPQNASPHTYQLSAYALDNILSLPTIATKSQLLAALEGHTLAEIMLIGRFQGGHSDEDDNGGGGDGGGGGNGGGY